MISKRHFFAASILFALAFLASCTGKYAAHDCDKSTQVAGSDSLSDISAQECGYFGLRNFSSAKKTDGADFSVPLNLPKFDKIWFAAADSMYSKLFPYTANRLNPWIAGDDFSAEFDKSPSQDAVYQGAGRNCQYALAKLANGNYLALLPLTVGKSSAWIYAGENNVIKLKASNFGTENLSGVDIPLLVWAQDKSPYVAVSKAWQIAASMPQLKGKFKLVSQKEYPEQFKYLGWCSWEQYHKNISSDLLCETVDNIKKSGVPIRWVLVDDGFQIEEKLRLKSFSPDPKRFPQGWKPLLDKRDEQIKWFGLWHCYYGLWNGIDAQNDFGALNDSLVKISDKVLMPAKSELDAQKFYDAFMGSVADFGFDFVKIDVQTGFAQHFKNQPNAVLVNNWCSQALENACSSHLNGIINCMAHNGATFFNSTNSAVIRCSVDYFKGKPNTAKSHLYQSYQNSIWLGNLFYPDHDMFHSSDVASARDMAISKALSAAPVYLSDDPKDFVKDLIMNLCFSDGEILRPLAPAVPLPESIFSQPLSNRENAYRVIAPLKNKCAAIMLHNLCQNPDIAPKFSNGMSLTSEEQQIVPPTPVSQKGFVSQQDYELAGVMMRPDSSYTAPREGLVWYDWYAKQGGKLEGKKEFLLERPLEGKLILLAPISKGWAVIGASDKFLSPVAVDFLEIEDDECELRIRDGGNFVIYLADGTPKSDDTQFKPLGNGLWQGVAPKGKMIIRK